MEKSSGTRIFGKLKWRWIILFLQGEGGGCGLLSGKLQIAGEGSKVDRAGSGGKKKKKKKGRPDDSASSPTGLRLVGLAPTLGGLQGLQTSRTWPSLRCRVPIGLSLGPKRTAISPTRT